MTPQDILNKILRDTKHDFTIFEKKAIDDLRKRIKIKELKGEEKPFVKCLIRNRDIILKPEEIVRQLYIEKLVSHYGYTIDRMAVENPVHFGREVKKADIVIKDNDREKIHWFDENISDHYPVVLNIDVSEEI